MHTCHKYATIVKRRKNKRTKKKGLYIYAFTRLFMRIMNFCVSTSICIFVCLCAFAYIDICIHPCVYAYREFPCACVSTPICIFVCLYAFAYIDICIHPCFYAYREFLYACVSTPISIFVCLCFLSCGHDLLTRSHNMVNSFPSLTNLYPRIS